VKRAVAGVGLYLAMMLAVQALAWGVMRLGPSARLGIGFDLEGWMLYLVLWPLVVWVARPPLFIAIVALAFGVGPVLAWKLSRARFGPLAGAALAAAAAQAAITAACVTGIFADWFVPF
jgi:hypothetical protein